MHPMDLCTVRVKTTCLLVKILLRPHAIQTVLLFLSLPCVTRPPEELNEAQVRRRLRGVMVSIPIGGVGSLLLAVTAGRVSIAEVLGGLCAHTLGPVLFFTLSCP